MIVIGAGPGGYVAAIRAAQLGQRTAVIEKDVPGGRCLNYACIPAKAVLHSADVYDEARNGAAELGVKVEGVSIDWDGVGKRRAKVSKTLAGGVSTLFDKNNVDYIEGDAALTSDANVKVGRKTYEAKGVVLATGSVALPIPGVEFGRRVVDTWGAWSLPEMPAEDGCGRRGGFGRGDRLRVRALRGRGDADRDARPGASGRGQGRRQGRRAGVQEAEHRRRPRDQGRAGRRGQGLGEGQVRRHGSRVRLPVHRRRPRPGHRGAEARRRRCGDRGRWKDQGRRVPAHDPRRRVRDRRSRSRRRARPQGLRGGGGRRRVDRRPPRRTRSIPAGFPPRPSATPRSRASG